MPFQRRGLIDNFQDAPGQLTPEEFEAVSVRVDNACYGGMKTLGPVPGISEWLARQP